MSDKNKGILIIITGRTAAGKDTIKAVLLEKYPKLKRVITTTSRKMREGEKNGTDYFFISRDEFEKKIKNGQFLEYVEYGGNLYGTTRSELKHSLADHDVLWKIDPSRAGEIRDLGEINKQIMVIYLNVSDDVVLKRLKQRGLTEEEIQKRMTDDKRIWQKYHQNYDYVIDNIPGKLDQTIQKIVKMIDPYLH